MSETFKMIGVRADIGDEPVAKLDPDGKLTIMPTLLPPDDDEPIVRAHSEGER